LALEQGLRGILGDDVFEQNTVKLSHELEKAKKAETILSTHKI